MSDQDQFSELAKSLSHFTRAIGHPARVAVLLAIARNGFKIQGEIIDVPPLSKATVLQHLRELKRAGLIHGRIFGAKAEYSLDMNAMKNFEASFHEFISKFGSTTTETA